MENLLKVVSSDQEVVKDFVEVVIRETGNVVMSATTSAQEVVKDFVEGVTSETGGVEMRATTFFDDSSAGTTFKDSKVFRINPMEVTEVFAGIMPDDITPCSKSDENGNDLTKKVVKLTTPLRQTRKVPGEVNVEQNNIGETVDSTITLYDKIDYLISKLFSGKDVKLITDDAIKKAVKNDQYQRDHFNFIREIIDEYNEKLYRNSLNDDPVDHFDNFIRGIIDEYDGTLHRNSLNDDPVSGDGFKNMACYSGQYIAKYYGVFINEGKANKILQFSLILSRTSEFDFDLSKNLKEKIEEFQNIWTNQGLTYEEKCLKEKNLKIDNLTNLFQELYESEERKKWLTDMLEIHETELGNEVEEVEEAARTVEEVKEAARTVEEVKEAAVEAAARAVEEVKEAAVEAAARAVEEYRFGARSCLYRINREVWTDDEHADKVKLLYKLHDEYAAKLPLTEVEYDEIINYIILCGRIYQLNQEVQQQEEENAKRSEEVLEGMNSLSGDTSATPSLSSSSSVSSRYGPSPTPDLHLLDEEEAARTAEEAAEEAAAEAAARAVEEVKEAAVEAAARAVEEVEEAARTVEEVKEAARTVEEVKEAAVEAAARAVEEVEEAARTAEEAAARQEAVCTLIPGINVQSEERKKNIAQTYQKDNCGTWYKKLKNIFFRCEKPSGGSGVSSGNFYVVRDGQSIENGLDHGVAKTSSCFSWVSKVKKNRVYHSSLDDREISV
jgi:predicted aldo/keto reductase-like oxidoreductase